MRVSVTPFRHPEYSALRERSESLALMWGIGHVCFVLFLVMAVAAPIAVAMAAMIDADVTRERAWSAIESSVAASLFFAAIGFAVRRYAAKKGRSPSEPH